MTRLKQRFTAPVDFTAPAISAVAQYVLVLARCAVTQRVVVIQKARPAWQAGRWNFPGGKIERGESPVQAAAREFAEETGLHLDTSELRPVALLRRPGQFDLYAFKTESPRIVEVKTLTDEPVSLVPVQAVLQGRHPAIENLPWLYGMAFDGSEKVAEVEYD